MRVLLVDDDVEMLESMRKMTLRAGPGWEVAGTAEDGVEALDLLREHPADILVTDITMVDMDGLELIARAKELLPGLRSLLITCHEDFHYAQEGIQLGVEDYLVKYTLTEPAFHKALERVRQKIEQARRQQDSLRHLSTEVYKNREHFRQSLVQALLHNPGGSGGLLARAPLYGLTLPEGPFTTAAVYLTFPMRDMADPDSQQLVLYAVMNVAQELIDFARCFAFPLEGRVYLLVWDARPAAGWRARLAQCLEHLRARFAADFGSDLCALVDLPPVTFTGLRQAMDRLEARRDALFYGAPVRLAEQIAWVDQRDEPVPESYLTQLESLLFDGPRLRAAFSAICTQIERRAYAPARVQLFLEQFITQLQVVARYSGRRLPYVPADGYTFAACRRRIEALLDILQEASFWQPGCRPGRDVQQVAEYVNAHLGEALTLERAAGLVHKNSSYFSRQFKRETGMAFSEFVIHQRVQRAAYLLRNTDWSLEQIAQEIGMASGQYFSTFYKRETGHTPGEERRL